MNGKTISLILDFVQFGSLLFLVLTGPVVSSHLVLATFQIMALLVLVAAIWEMRRNKFYRVPDVGKQDSLVTSGIYRFIRHPMYTAQILFASTLIGNYLSFLRLPVFLLLVANYLCKIQYEEKLLAKYFPDYQKYKKNSFRLVPFVY